MPGWVRLKRSKLGPCHGLSGRAVMPTPISTKFSVFCHVFLYFFSAVYAWPSFYHVGLGQVEKIKMRPMPRVVGSGRAVVPTPISTQFSVFYRVVSCCIFSNGPGPAHHFVLVLCRFFLACTMDRLMNF